MPPVKPMYLSLETDDEFRKRLRDKGVRFVNVKTTVERTGWYGVKYTETHEERTWIELVAGDALDNTVWDTCKTQRRLIERG